MATSRKNALEGEPVSSLHATAGPVQVPEVSTDYGGAVHLPAPPARTFKPLDVRRGEEGMRFAAKAAKSPTSYFNWQVHPFPLLA